MSEEADNEFAAVLINLNLILQKSTKMRHLLQVLICYIFTALWNCIDPSTAIDFEVKKSYFIPLKCMSCIFT